MNNWWELGDISPTECGNKFSQTVFDIIVCPLFSMDFYRRNITPA